MKQSFIDVQNTKVCINEWGDEDNPIIICLHGLGSTSLSFIEVAEMLKDRFHIFSIDLPGHGKTPAFLKESDYEMPNIVKWLSYVIKNITEDNFYFIAHSWGADIALHYSVHNPKNVNKLILFDGGYYDKETIYEYFTHQVDEELKSKVYNSLENELNFYEKDFDEYIFPNWKNYIELERKNYSRWSKLMEEASTDLMVEEKGKLRFRARGNTARAAIKAMYKHPTKEIFSKLVKPVLLLKCTTPESWKQIRNNLSKQFEEKTNATIREIKETTHIIHWDKPNEVVKEILDWI